MEKINILLVEDDENLGMILKESLEYEGYSVEWKKDGEEGWKAFNKLHYDICLLDIMMPKKDGLTLAKEIRKVDQNIPLIFLTAKSMKEDKIEGFKSGGDDYITKPFSMEELLLRMEAILRRTKKTNAFNEGQAKFNIGKFEFDPRMRQLNSNGDSQKLTTKESQLLRLLCIHENDILERDVALKTIWGDDNYFTGRSMDVYITKLRKYLKQDERIEIQNIHGTGFKLVINQ
ncbi:MAG: response regulator transcription factor [Bacteroidia bacterium]|nr:response regulator transcription factor [Bacteroidia bacterium]